MSFTLNKRAINSGFTFSEGGDVLEGLFTSLVSVAGVSNVCHYYRTVFKVVF